MTNALYDALQSAKTEEKTQNTDIIRTQITLDNLKQVFDKWVLMIGREIGGVSEDNYNLFLCRHHE